MNHEAIVVGGGIAGLTAAAYLSRAGRSVLLLEKEADTGGLVTSFRRGGFLFDGGIRSIEDSGIVRPMLRQLGIDIEFLASEVSVGFKRDVIKVSSKESLEEYRKLLCRQFPDDENDIQAIVAELVKVMEYMDVLYGIDNPLFMDLKGNPEYVFKTILPWLFKYIVTVPKIAKLNFPVDEYLARFTRNRALIDMIGQHFFTQTPAFFALSYFSLYLDYAYPKGGTGTLTRALHDFVLAHGGEIRTGTKIARVAPGDRVVIDSAGVEYGYGKLVWAADLKALYASVDTGSIADAGVVRGIEARTAELADKRGGDSVFTVYLSLNLPPSYFSGIASAHFFYTPVTEGLSAVDARPILLPEPSPGRKRYTDDKAAVFAWAARFLDLNTYEIACPALRNPELAPEGKTGLIVSLLMDHGLFEHIRAKGWLDEFNRTCADRIIGILDSAIFPGLREAVIDSFTATPLTIVDRTGNSDGAITGWSFLNHPMPAVSSMPGIAKSVLTPIPHVFQAGQWSYSPAGLPISVLTGKLAADKVDRELRS